MSGVNRFFQRKRFAEFQPLSMQEMAFPFEKQEARTRENMAMASKLSSLGLDINNLPVDNPYVEQNVLPNWQKQKDELVKSYLAPNANARELAAKTYELYNTKQQIEGTTGKYLGQRLNTYNQKLKELEEDKTLNSNERNALKAQLYNAFTEYAGGANPLEGVELPRWTASYNPTDVEKRVQDSLKTVVDRDNVVGKALEGFNPNEYTSVYQFLSGKGVDSKKIEAVLDPLINDVGLKQSLRQQYDLMGGEEAFGQSFEEYRENTFNDLLNSAIAAKAGYNYDIDRMTFEDDLRKQKFIDNYEFSKNASIGSNGTVLNITSTAFADGNTSLGGLETNRTNLTNRQAELKQLLANPNLDESLVSQYTSQLADVTDRLALTNKIYNEVKPVFDANKNETDLAIIDKINSLSENELRNNLLSTELKDSALPITSIIEGVSSGILNVKKSDKTYNSNGVPVKSSAHTVTDSNGNTVGSFTGDAGNYLLELYNNDSKQRKVIKSQLEKYNNISLDTFTSTGDNLPGYSDAQNKDFWDNELPKFIGNISNVQNFSLLNGTRIADEVNALDGKEKETMLENLSKLDKSNVSIGTNPNLTGDLIMSIKVPYQDKDGNLKSKDFQLSMDNNGIVIGNEATANITQTPQWELQSKIRMIQSTGNTGEVTIPSLSNWVFNVTDNNDVSKIVIKGVDGEEKEFTESKAMELYTKYYPYIKAAEAEGWSQNEIYSSIFAKEKE